mgnify:CR=1 FL=1
MALAEKDAMIHHKTSFNFPILQKCFPKSLVAAPNQTLHDADLCNPFPVLLQNYQRTRSACVRVGTIVSSSHPQSNRIFQGSLLSNIIFIAAINKDCSLIPIYLILLDDNLNIYIYQSTHIRAPRLLQSAIPTISSWLGNMVFESHCSNPTS